MKNKNFLNFASLIFSVSFLMIGSSAMAGCQSKYKECSGTIIDDPLSMKYVCAGDEVYCDTSAGGFPTGSPPTGGSCPGSCQSACSAGQSEILGPFTDCINKACCVTAGGGLNPGGNANPGANSGGWNINSVTKYGLPEGSILGIIENILYWLLSALGLVGVIGFLISGILYLISTGDEDMTERAKNAMKWSIVGVIVGLLGVVIIQAVDKMLSGWGFF